MAYSDCEHAAPELAHKCKHCHLFIEENEYDSDFPNIARWVHLTRGDEADEFYDDHDAEPSGMLATLDVWREYGPTMMRLRFTVGVHALTVTPIEADLFDNPDPGEPALNPVEGWCACNEGTEWQWGYTCPDPDALWDAWRGHVEEQADAPTTLTMRRGRNGETYTRI